MVKRSDALRRRFRRKLMATKPPCHICGQAIDYTLPYSDPKCFVADHVIPLAKGGADAFSNIASAHRDCNSTKRARMVAPIIRRSGALER